MRPQRIAGKFRQLRNLPLSCWVPFFLGWQQRHRTGYVPCAFPGSLRIVQVPIGAFYESYQFCCEVKQGVKEMEFFLAKLRPGDVLYDVGAFYGAFGAAAKATHGNSIEIHSFEPVVKNLRRITEIYQRNHFERVTIVGKALGSGACISGTVDAEDGMLRRRDGMLRGADSALLDDRSAEFPSTSIDAYSVAAGAAPTVLKIDVEGFEVDVLEGARETLRNHHPRVWLELHPNFLAEQGKNWRETVEGLKATGYKVTFFEDFELPSKDIAFHIWCEL